MKARPCIWSSRKHWISRDSQGHKGLVDSYQPELSVRGKQPNTEHSKNTGKEAPTIIIPSFIRNSILSNPEHESPETEGAHFQRHCPPFSSPHTHFLNGGAYQHLQVWFLRLKGAASWKMEGREGGWSLSPGSMFCLGPCEEIPWLESEHRDPVLRERGPCQPQAGKVSAGAWLKVQGPTRGIW